MQVKLSEDQCTLTVNGEEYQARPTTIGASCDGCYFSTKPGCILNRVGMKRGCTPFPGGQGRKGDLVVWEKKETNLTAGQITIEVDGVERVIGQMPSMQSSTLDKKLVFWLNNENKMQEEVKPHVHCDMMIAYAKNPTLKVFVWYKNDWQKVAGSPPWDPQKIYAIGEKPTQPPVRMVTYLGGTIQFPLPVLYKLRPGTEYFCINAKGIVERYTWRDSYWDIYQLRAGSIHLDESSAKAQQKAFQELLRKQVDSWVQSN